MVRELVGYGAAIKAGDVSGWVGIWGAGVFFFGGGGGNPEHKGWISAERGMRSRFRQCMIHFMRRA